MAFLVFNLARAERSSLCHGPAGRTCIRLTNESDGTDVCGTEERRKLEERFWAWWRKIFRSRSWDGQMDLQTGRFLLFFAQPAVARPPGKLTNYQAALRGRRRGQPRAVQLVSWAT